MENYRLKIEENKNLAEGKYKYIYIFRKEICEYCVTGEIKAEDGKFL